MIECVTWDLLCQGTENFNFQHSLWWFDHCCPQPSGTLLLFLKGWIKIWKMSVLLPACLVSYLCLTHLGADFGAVLVLGCQENSLSPVVWVVRLGMPWDAQEDVEHSTAAAPEVNYCSLEIINWGLLVLPAPSWHQRSCPGVLCPSTACLCQPLLPPAHRFQRVICRVSFPLVKLQ